MTKHIIVLLTILISTQVKAQFIKEKSLEASLGYGISSPYEDIDEDITGTGVYLQLEYVFTHSNWIDFRPYAGILITNTDNNEQNDNGYKSTTKAFLMGGKVRTTIPIPYVAPYIEFGLGASIGSFETFTPYANLKDNGIIFHSPFSIGLELGKNHNINLEYTYYYHPSVKQFGGAIAFGIAIPLKQ